MDKSTVFQKPDEIDTPAYKKPNPICYGKPNAYDEEPPVVITASRHGSRSSRITVDSFSSRYFQRRRNSTATTSVSSPSSSANCFFGKDNQQEKRFSNSSIESPPSSPKLKKDRNNYSSQIDYQNITSYILSQSTSTTQTTFGHHEQLKDDETSHSKYVLPSSPANSIVDTPTATAAIHNDKGTNTATAAALFLTNEASIITSSLLRRSTDKSKNKLRASETNNNTISINLISNSKNNIVAYNFRKAHILKPHQHHIFLHIDHHDGYREDEDVMVYRKIQPYTYTGLQSMLYSNRNDGQGVKVAEARRRAFQKETTIEVADYENSLVDDISKPHIENLKNTPPTGNIHCQELTKRSQSNILFEYETFFHGSQMRWKRPSLLSHDFTCEIKLTKEEKKKQQHDLLMQKKLRQQTIGTTAKLRKKKGLNSVNVLEQQMLTKGDGFIDSDSDNDEDDHDNHSHKTCRRWKLLAEFDSHNNSMTSLSKDLGKLSIDLDILNQVEKDRCDLLEANIVMTCCTLIDLIRELMERR